MVIVHQNSVNREAISINYTEQFGSWAIPLQAFIMSSYMDHLMNFINQKYLLAAEGLKKDLVFPTKQENIFKAFKLCEYDDLKIVVLGNKPYVNFKSNGLAYGNSKGGFSAEISPDLKNIRSCVLNTCYSQRDPGLFDITLENWAKQGILLLNSTLTSQIGQNHEVFWKNFTRTIIETINKKKDKILFLCLDNSANYFKKYIDTTKHMILENNHMTLSKDCEIFLKADEYMYDTRKQTIMW